MSLRKSSDNEDIVPNTSDEDDDDRSDVFPMLTKPNILTDDKVYFQGTQIFCRKTERCEIGKRGQKKKNIRVFKTRHSCLYCGCMVAKPSLHLQQVHQEEIDVVKLLVYKISEGDREEVIERQERKSKATAFEK